MAEKGFMKAVKMDFRSEGAKIEETGRYEFNGKKYRLRTLDNMSERLESEINEGKSKCMFPKEILTIVMQMRKKAYETIIKDRPTHTENKSILKDINSKIKELKEKDFIVSSSEIKENPKDEQMYIRILNMQVEDQERIDLEKELEELKEKETR